MTQYFSNLLTLLDIERKTDIELYRQITERSGAPERRSAGLTWYPVAIRGSEWARGDYLTIEFERTTHRELPHQLRFGMPAALFSHHDPKESRIEGVITHVSGNQVTISFRTEELPDWASDGKLGIDLLFDSNSYDVMKDALKAADQRMDRGEDGRLIRILTGQQQPSFNDTLNIIPPPSLNIMQQAAVDLILKAGDLAIVHGPPGTGKTTTLVQAIKAIVSSTGEKVLVTAPSNTAVDLLTEKLSDLGLSVIRVGNPARVSEKLTNLTIDSKMSAHPMMKEVRTLKKRANEFRNLAHKYKRQFGKAEREQRKALFEEAHRMLKDISGTEQYILDDILAKANVICATLVGANHYTVRELKYQTVVIDEAGQALEPSAWIPVLKGKKLVLAGDHFQLPPTVKSREAAEKGLSETLLEKTVACHPAAVIMLEEQYRMNEVIAGYSSGLFYDDLLRAGEPVRSQLMFPGDIPLLFIDTAGCGFEEKMEGKGISNAEEALFVVKHLANYLAEVEQKKSTGSTPSVAVISPYRNQIEVLSGLAQDRSELSALGSALSVNTIDSFQGQERDVVYISLTRSNADQQIGFLSEVRRMNVAMTRARKKLVVIGDSATLSRLSYYEGFIKYAEEHGGYASAWEFME